MNQHKISHPHSLLYSLMSADRSINASNESPMSTRPPSPEQPSREEQAQVLRDTYPILTDQEIQRILGPNRSQLSLLAQIQGGTLSPQLARNVSQGENMHPKVLHGIIDAMAETAQRTNSQHAVEKGLLEEALDDLQRTRVPTQCIDTKRPFEEAPPGYQENRGQVDLDLPCKDGLRCPAKWVKRMDGGRVASYTEDDSPGDLPLITDLYALRVYYDDDNEDPAGALPAWFIAALGGSGTTYATLRREFDKLAVHNWGFVAEIDRYRAMDEQCQTLCTQIDLLEQELQMARVERGLSKGRLEVAKADRQVRHLRLGQTGARTEQIRIRTDLVRQDRNARHGRGRPF